MAFPNHAKQQILEAWLSGATVKVGLLDNGSSYTFSVGSDEFVSDLPTGQEPTDASYARQGVTNLQFNQDDTDDEGVFDADNVTFSSLSTTNDIQAIFMYIQIGGDDASPGDDPLVVVYDDDSAGSLSDLPLPTNGSDVTINWSAEGIVNIQ